MIVSGQLGVCLGCKLPFLPLVFLSSASIGEQLSEVVCVEPMIILDKQPNGIILLVAADLKFEVVGQMGFGRYVR
jgi:hypothetical protein